MTNQELQILKNKFDIIGNDPALNRALEIAVAVAPTDITVLVSGESGVGKTELVKILASASFEDINITDPDLDEVFMHYYAKEEN